jgi:hypothetical protein
MVGANDTAKSCKMCSCGRLSRNQVSLQMSDSTASAHKGSKHKQRFSSTTVLDV